MSQGLQHYLDYKDCDKILLWNEGDKIGYIMKILVSINREVILKNLSLCCEAFLNAEGIAAANLAASLLHIAFPQGYLRPEENIEDINSLTSDQQKVIATLIISNLFLWSFVNFTDLIRNWGLPYYKGTLISLLKSKGSIEIYRDLFEDILKKREFFWELINEFGWNFLDENNKLKKKLEWKNEIIPRRKKETNIINSVNNVDIYSSISNEVMELEIPELFGKILLDFGKSIKNLRTESFGKDLIASCLSNSNKINDLKLAIKLFEEAKSVSKKYYSPKIYQYALKKLKNLDKII